MSPNWPLFIEVLTHYLLPVAAVSIATNIPRFLEMIQSRDIIKAEMEDVETGNYFKVLLGFPLGFPFGFSHFNCNPALTLFTAFLPSFVDPRQRDQHGIQRTPVRQKLHPVVSKRG